MDLWPSLANLRDHPFQIFQRALGRIDVRGSQLRAEQKLVAKDIERQIAVTIVVAMKEPPFLMSMNRIIGRIRIQNDLLLRPRMRIEKLMDHHLINRFRIHHDLLIALCWRRPWASALATKDPEGSRLIPGGSDVPGGLQVRYRRSLPFAGLAVSSEGVQMKHKRGKTAIRTERLNKRVCLVCPWRIAQCA
jgi:hypothetical protein